MTILHWIVLALCAAAAIVASDMLGHRGVRPWPVGLLTIALVVLAGVFYSPWLAAAGLGFGTGLLILAVGSLARTFLKHRSRRRSERGVNDPSGDARR
ncbi:hypothetical protein [Microbacterium halophytorum]|uniref:hypothetical protein n=1 Tax=Microbacterium halophytorum TaxID=2067568 RepID=UPI000CFD14B7|nr:hypothetical protein [Microbacterium halophytorum]